MGAIVKLCFQKHELGTNRPSSYSRYWTGTSLQWRLIRGEYHQKQMNLICIRQEPALNSVSSKFQSKAKNTKMVNHTLTFCFSYLFSIAIFQSAIPSSLSLSSVSESGACGGSPEPGNTSAQCLIKSSIIPLTWL